VPVPPILVAVPRVLALAAATGLVAAAVAVVQGRRAAVNAPAMAAWALAVAWGVGVYAMVAAYDGHGGHTHPRYLFPGVAVLAVAGAVGLDRLPGARRGLWVGGATLAQLALTGVAWAAFVTALRGRRPETPADLAGAVAGLLAADDTLWPWLVLGIAGALLVAAWTLLGLALARLGSQPRELSAPDPIGSGVDVLTDARREEVAAGRASWDQAPAP
jgi:hypothetical protein